MNTPFVKAVLTVLRKDLLNELRSRELISSMVLFAFLSVLVFSFALELNREAREEVISGVLWVTIVFAVILGLNRSLAAEREQGNLDAMLIAPIGRAAIFVGKGIANFLFALLVAALLVPVMTVLYNINLVEPLLLLTLVLGIFGFTTIGTLLATMTVQTRSRETLLPIVMLPAALPVLLAAVTISNGILDARAEALWIGWVPLLAVINLVYAILCFLLFPFVIEE